MKGITVVSIAVSMALGGISGSAARAEQLVDVTLPEYTGIPRPPLKPWTWGPNTRGNVLLHDDFNRPDETPALFVAITADGVRAIEVRSGVRRVLVSVITVSRSVS